MKDPIDCSDTSEVLFTPISTGRAFDGISGQIRQAMADGKLKAGERLPAERDLAVRFGVSRNTLREALRTLESSGILELKRGGQAGAYIKQSSGAGVADGLLDMYRLGGLTPGQLTEARILLESSIVRAACASATEQDLRRLEENLGIAVQHHKANRVQERIDTNLDFHRLVARATHNPLLVTLMSAVLDVMEAFIRSIGPYEANFVFASRRRFLKHLTARNADAAVHEMEDSLRRLQKRYLSRLDG